MHQHHGSNGQCEQGQGFCPTPPVEFLGIWNGPNPGPNPPQLGQDFPLAMATAPGLYDQDAQAHGPELRVYQAYAIRECQSERCSAQQEPSRGPVVVEGVTECAKADGQCEKEKQGPLRPFTVKRAGANWKHISRSFRWGGHSWGVLESKTSIIYGEKKKAA